MTKKKLLELHEDLELNLELAQERSRAALFICTVGAQNGTPDIVRKSISYLNLKMHMTRTCFSKKYEVI